MKHTINAIMAGLCITLGCCVYLACESVYVGAVVFSVALLCICYQGYSLFTGKVGYLAQNHTRQDWTIVGTALLGNLIATVCFGTLARFGVPTLQLRAQTICTAKLAQPLVQALIRGYFCGVLMYLAVNLFREHHTVTGIFLCVPAFILSGFEHSIADMGYFAVAGLFGGRTVLFLLTVVLGNALGGLTLPFLQRHR